MLSNFFNYGKLYTIPPGLQRKGYYGAIVGNLLF